MPGDFLQIIRRYGKEHIAWYPGHRVLGLALWLALCCAAQLSFSQTLSGEIPFSRYEGKPLKRTLQVLNKRFDVAFSYNPEAIEGILTPFVADSSGIETFLTASLESTGLEFEFIGGVFVLFPSEKEALDQVAIRRYFALSGIVRDKYTGETLPFAAIAISYTRIETTANTDGKFTLLKVPSDTSQIQVRYLGYKPLKLRLTPLLSRSYLTLEMTPQEKLLPSIQIVAEKDELIELESEAGHFSFNPSEISKLPVLGEPDLFSVLRRLPGISGGQEVGSGIKIRGSDSDQNLVLLDGIPVYHIDHFFGFFSAFNPGVIKNIQVFKGGYSAAYGGRSSGLVNITAIEGNRKKPALQADVNMLSTSVIAELPIVEDRASIVFAYRRGFTGFLRSPTFRNIFNNIYNTRLPTTEQGEVDVFKSDNIPDFFYYDLNAKATFKPTANDAISINFYDGADDLTMQFEAAPAEILRLSRDNTRWGNTGGSFKWSRQWNKRWYTYGIFGLSSYRSNLNAEESYLFNETELISRRFFEQRTRLSDRTFRLDNTYEWDENTALEFGYWYTEHSILTQAQDQEVILTDSLQTTYIHAVYMQMTRKLGPVRANIGLRGVYHDVGKKAMAEPRVNITADASPHLSFKSGFGIFHQMIRRVNERSIYFSIPETWVLSGYGDIPVLRCIQYSAGAVWSKEGWSADAELYLKSESGTTEILFPETGFAGGSLDQLAVDGTRTITGLDFLLKRNFSNQNILLSYSFLNAQSKYPGVNENQYFRSSGYGTHEVGLMYNIARNKWDFSGAFVLADGIPYTEIVSFNQPGSQGGGFQLLADKINGASTPWYHRLDASAGYSFAWKNALLQTGVAVYNLYNNRAVRFIDYFVLPAQGANEPQLIRREVPALALTPSAFIKVKF